VEVATAGTAGRVFVGHGEDIAGPAMMFPMAAPGKGHRIGGTANKGHATGWSDRSIVRLDIHVVDEAEWASKGKGI
jgi:hypothetical protein